MGMDFKDSEIIDLYFQRSEQALNATKQQYGRLIYYVINRILLRAEDREEIFNDTLMGLWQAIPPNNPTVLSSFICRIARNLALKRYDYIHAAKRNPAVEVAFTELEHALASTNEAQANYTDDLLALAINSFLADLNKEQRNIFVRRYWYFDSIKEIGERYGVSQSKVESILFRARNRLRAHLIKRGF